MRRDGGLDVAPVAAAQRHHERHRQPGREVVDARVPLREPAVREREPPEPISREPVDAGLVAGEATWKR